MVGLIGVVISSTALAGVKSFSKEIYTKNSDTDVYWEVTVRCSDNNKKRVIRQAVKGDDQWCAKEVPSLCGRTKMNTARAVCTNRYTRGLKQNTNKAESEQVAVKKPVAVAKTQPKVQETPKAAKVVAPVASVDSVSSGSDDLSIQQGQVSIEEKSNHMPFMRVNLTISKRNHP